MLQENHVLMPKVDLETLMDHKIACETTADFPPESFWLSKDAEFDWFNHNAYYERNESSKGNNSNTNPVLESSSSRRYCTNVKSKPSILGLPKTQKTNFTKKNGKKKPSNVRLFPKRTGSMNKPANQLNEPSSPNVSCMGRVKSKRKNRKRTEPEKVNKVLLSKGICKQFLSMFRSKPVVRCGEPVREPVKRRVNEVGTVRTGVEPVPPGLGAMKRFASGRKSSSSAADVDEVVG